MSEPSLKKRRLLVSKEYSWRAEAKKNLKAEIQRLVQSAEKLQDTLPELTVFMFKWGELGPTVEHGILDASFGMGFQAPRFVPYRWNHKTQRSVWIALAKEDYGCWKAWVRLPFPGKIAALRLSHKREGKTGETGRNLKMLEKRMTREHWKVHDRLVQLNLPHSLAALIVCYTGY